MAKKPLNIGMIGYGFMGRAHSNAWRKVGNFFDLEYQPVLKAVAARNKAKAEDFAYRWGYESVETDWKKLVARDDIDAVDICVPNDLHMEIAIAAAKAGKMVLCEKPLARTTKEGEKMVAAVEKAKVANLVWYNYRYVPAVTLIKQVVAGLDASPPATASIATRIEEPRTRSAAVGLVSLLMDSERAGCRRRRRRGDAAGAKG